MFSGCTSVTGRVISEGLAPCPMRDGKAYNFESLADDANKLQAKLHAFDSWLWTDCEGGKDQFEPTLQVDCIQASRSRSEDDPPLFRGHRLSIENNVHYIAANRAALANKASPPNMENAKNRALNECASEDPEAKLRPLVREVPDDLDENRARQDDMMHSRADAMKAAMHRRSLDMQNEWAKGTKKLQAWLVKNNFFSVNTRRNGLLSFTYPLHIAAAQNDIEVIHLLILREADPSQLDSRGRTALQVAAKKCKNGSHRKVVTALTAVS